MLPVGVSQGSCLKSESAKLFGVEGVSGIHCCKWQQLTPFQASTANSKAEHKAARGISLTYAPLSLEGNMRAS
jgi:hypothetical protein